jgi:hypothetical protein
MSNYDWNQLIDEQGLVKAIDAAARSDTTTIANYTEEREGFADVAADELMARWAGLNILAVLRAASGSMPTYGVEVVSVRIESQESDRDQPEGRLVPS